MGSYRSVGLHPDGSGLGSAAHRRDSNDSTNALNAAPWLVREYTLTVVCREPDEIHMRAVLSNSMSSAPLSFQSLTSRDYEGDQQRIEVTATLKLHPKDQSSLELIATRLSMEKGVWSVSCLGLELEPAPEQTYMTYHREAAIKRWRRSPSIHVSGVPGCSDGNTGDSRCGFACRRARSLIT